MGKLIKVGLIVAGVLALGKLISIIRTNSYDKDGYNGYGYDREGRDREGYDHSGFDSDGYNQNGFDKFGRDREGYSESGFDKNGYDRSGYDKQGYDQFGYRADGIDRGGMSRQEAEDDIRVIEEMKNKARAEMKENCFREALTNIRAGIDHCVMLLLKHRAGKDFDDYETTMQYRIQKCGEYKLLNTDEIAKLQEARRHSNAIHKLCIDKDFSQIFFCYKSFEELIEKVKEILDLDSYEIICIQPI